MKKINYSEFINKKIGNCIILEHAPYNSCNTRFLVKCLNCGKEIHKHLGKMKKDRGCKHCKRNSKCMNNIGKRFGKLIITGLDYRTKDGAWNYKCQCDCGVFCTRRLETLKRNGDNSECGECVKKRVSFDLENKKIGKCKAISSKKYPGDPNKYWLCICNCGNEFERQTHTLLHQKGKDQCDECFNRYYSKKKSKDWLGHKFGTFTVIKHIYKRDEERWYWLCECECGEKELKRSNSIALSTKTNTKTTCYICKNKKRSVNRAIQSARKKAHEIHKNRVGKKFGNLKVIKYYGFLSEETGSAPVFLCKCKCGNTVVRDAVLVGNGFTNSCGCFHKKASKENRALTDEEIELAYNMSIISKYNRRELSKIFNVRTDTLYTRLKIWAEENNKVLPKRTEFHRKTKNTKNEEK